MDEVCIDDIPVVLETPVEEVVTAPHEGLRRSTRPRRPPYAFWLNQASVNFEPVPEPSTLLEALKSNHAAEWKSAADCEYDSLMRNNTWELCKLPSGRKAIHTRWVFTVKFNPDGTIAKHKARLVAKGYEQKYGIDYFETFAPVVSYTSLRLLLAIAAKCNFRMDQMDAVTAFLNGELDEEIYIYQPEGYEVDGQEDLVGRARKSIYGLKQSPLCWNKKMDKRMLELGFVSSSADPCVYIKRVRDQVLFVALYVDDLLLIGNSDELIDETKNALSERFEMKDLGEAKYALGMLIQRYDDGSIHLSQMPYIRDKPIKYGMADCRPVSTPKDAHDSNNALPKAGAKGTTDIHFRSAVGALNYLAISTRPDISTAVGEVARHVENPQPHHFVMLKRIFRYLQGTSTHGLYFARDDTNSPMITLEGYSDANWGEDTTDRRSISGMLFTIGSGPVCWKSKKQPTVAASTAEPEYMALFLAVQEAI